MNRLILVTSLVVVTTVPLYGEETPEPLYEGKPLDYWVKRLKTSETREQREEAVGAIRDFGPDAAPAVPVLVSMLDDRSCQYRQLVGDLLCHLGPVAKAAIPALVQSLKNKTARTPEVVLQVLANIGPDAREATKVVITALDDPKLELLAFETLCSINPPAEDALPAIRKAISKAKAEKGDYSRLRCYISDLKNFGGYAIPLLVELLDIKDQNVVKDAAETLGEFGPEANKAVPALTKFLRSDDAEFRESVAFALLKIDKNPEAIKVVTASLTVLPKFNAWDGPIGYYYKLETAAKAIGEVGQVAKSALPSLRKLLACENKDVQQAARDAIRKIEESETKP